MDKKEKNKSLILIIIGILVVLLIWGLIGGQQSQEIGITCDFGLGENLCWKWHTNVIGQIQEGFEDFRESIEDSYGY